MLVTPSIGMDRQQVINACVAEAIPRCGGALMKAIDRCHVLIAALRGKVTNESMLERSERMPERLCGLQLAESLLMEGLSLHLIVERHAGQFDQEQLLHDVQNEVRKFIRNLV